MTDELRRLAEAARDLPKTHVPMRPMAAYIAAAKPQRILALLDVVEAAQRALVAWRGDEEWSQAVENDAMSALREALDRLEALA